MPSPPDLRSIVRRIRRDVDALRTGHEEQIRRLDRLNLQIELVEGLLNVDDGWASERRTLRQSVLSLLGLVGLPLNSAQVADLVEMIDGAPVRPERLGTLAADERKAFDRGKRRGPWLCHVLLPGTGADVPAVRSTWARSDWPAEERVSVSTQSMRVLALRQVVRFCDLAVDPAMPEPQREIWAQTAVWEGRFHRLLAEGSSDLGSLRERAGELLELDLFSDRSARTEAATDLSGLDPKTALFGTAAATEP